MITNLVNKKKKKAFTLVEVIIVLAIIAIIAAIAIPNLTKVRTESKIKADTQSAESIRNTALMIITDDKIKVQATDTNLYLAFDTKGKCTGLATVIAGTALADTNTILSPGVTAASVSDYFKGIKAPQSDVATNYKITIVGTGSTTETPGNVILTVVNASDAVTAANIVVK